LAGDGLRKYKAIVTYYQNVYSGDKETGKERETERNEERKKGTLPHF